MSNADDLCPATALGSAIDNNGCSGSQFIALRCNADAFSNHGRYVSCVSHAASEAVDLGLIARQERSRYVSQAAKSNK